MRRFHNTHSLQRFLTHQNANLRKLNSAVGGQIRTHDRGLNKISGGNPIENYIHTLAGRDGIFDDFIDSIPRTLFSTLRTGVRQSGLFDVSGQNSRQSQSQIWATAANAITRAISRNL